VKPRVTGSTKRDTKTIGDISETHVILAMRKLGYHVVLPFGGTIDTISWSTTERSSGGSR